MQNNLGEFFKQAAQWLDYRQQMVRKEGPDGCPFNSILNQVGQLDTAIEMKLILQEKKKELQPDNWWQNYHMMDHR